MPSTKPKRDNKAIADTWQLNSEAESLLSRSVELPEGEDNEAIMASLSMKLVDEILRKMDLLQDDTESQTEHGRTTKKAPPVDYHLPFHRLALALLSGQLDGFLSAHQRMRLAEMRTRLDQERFYHARQTPLVGSWLKGGRPASTRYGRTSVPCSDEGPECLDLADDLMNARPVPPPPPEAERGRQTERGGKPEAVYGRAELNGDRAFPQGYRKSWNFSETLHAPHYILPGEVHPTSLSLTLESTHFPWRKPGGALSPERLASVHCTSQPVIPPSVTGSPGPEEPPTVTERTLKTSSSPPRRSGGVLTEKEKKRDREAFMREDPKKLTSFGTLTQVYHSQVPAYFTQKGPHPTLSRDPSVPKLPDTARSQGLPLSQRKGCTAC
uniref:Uncharacterized protein n=1 Tax=Chromera velia CCMP2878 TaxID=1169474 RepID=A0A0G4I7Q9_9ALVE|eukprot:Cvel_11754.t1-p1 / transcript=Cvel_11754.t1 / gene=Cvel_11754 / organism=Chromera_velia_CCMP2878 / gene_product=hypothetical protein / transcript_product=hypothetical protein / location=Cvel_scaffold747:14473-15778(-) / protein_length=382 / sequence_SO=supercontig / SO=protein_coding / is_pseudo=false